MEISYSVVESFNPVVKISYIVVDSFYSVVESSFYSVVKSCTFFSVSTEMLIVSIYIFLDL